MDRRVFFGSAVAICGSLVFSRKTESVPSEVKGLTHEQMAEIILNHPLTVYLHGDMEHFGRVREEAGKWRTGRDCIVCDFLYSQGGRIKVVNGCRVEVHYRAEVHCKSKLAFRSTPLGAEVRNQRGLVNSLDWFDSEEWFDISQPELKLIRCTGRDTHSTKYPRIIRRNFARLGERWLEI